MIRALHGLSDGDQYQAWLTQTLARVGRMTEDTLRYYAIQWTHVRGAHALVAAAESELRRRAALEADEPPLRGRALRRSHVERVLNASPKTAGDAVVVLGDAIAVIASIAGENIAVTLAHVLRNHSSTTEAIWALSVVERLRAEAS